MRKSMPSNVHIHAVALSDRIGAGRFAIPVSDGEELTTRASLEPGANPGFAEVFRDVRLTTLDSLSLKDIAAIKIDVEGHEGAVLDGASETIVRERPVVIVEIEERHHPGQSYSIFDRLKRHGYICCFIRDQELNLFEVEKMHELQPAGFIPPIGKKPAGYVNNFIFLPFERRDISSAIAKELGIVDMTRVDRTR
jgi:FkbM family methyltransferase